MTALIRSRTGGLAHYELIIEARDTAGNVTSRSKLREFVNKGEALQYCAANMIIIDEDRTLKKKVKA